MILFLFSVFFSVFLAVGLSYLKIHALIKISWLAIISLTLFWELVVIFGVLLSLPILLIVIVLALVITALAIGIVSLPFAGIGFLIYWLFSNDSQS